MCYQQTVSLASLCATGQPGAILITDRESGSNQEDNIDLIDSLLVAMIFPNGLLNS